MRRISLVFFIDIENSWLNSNCYMGTLISNCYMDTSTLFNLVVKFSTICIQNLNYKWWFASFFPWKHPGGICLMFLTFSRSPMQVSLSRGPRTEWTYMTSSVVPSRLLTLAWSISFSWRHSKRPLRGRRKRHSGIPLLMPRVEDSSSLSELTQKRG